MYTISQLSPKSASIDEYPQGEVLQTNHPDLGLRIESSIDHEEEAVIPHEEVDEHVIIARSADPTVRESRSINIDEIPPSNNEIDNHLELHNKRKYYDIHPTKTMEYLRSDDEVILSSEGFGDRLEFKFPGEGKRVPKARALAPMGPRIRPTAVQPIFATATPREGRQNTEIQNIITGLVKLLNGKVNVQANSQLLRPGRPMASRINNRGPPKLSEGPPIPDFDVPITPPPHHYHPTKTPPPYPFDRPPVYVNLPEQMVPPLNRPGFHRPIPPWQRPRPRPPNRRPNPSLPMYKPNLPPIPNMPDLPDENEKLEEDVANENETTHSENNIHNEESEFPLTIPELNTTETDVKEDEQKDETTTVADTTTTSTTTTTTTTTTTQATTTEKQTTTEKPTTTEKTTTTTQKPSTTTEKTTTTEKPTTTTEKKIEKPKADKKKDTILIEKDKNKDKFKIDDKSKLNITKDDLLEQAIQIIEPSLIDLKPSSVADAVPTPTNGLISHAPSSTASTTTSSVEVIETSSINSQPIASK